MSRVGASIRAALIDLDGTLVDTLGDFTFALNLMMADLGLDVLTPAQVQSCIGRGSEHLIRAALGLQMPDASKDEVESRYPRAWQLYQDHYRAHNGQHSRVYPGVAEGLELMKQRGWPLACVTNKPAEFARELLRQKGLERHFDHVCGGDSWARKKPDPMPLLKTCEQLNTAPGCTLMVGDSVIDAQAAQAAGCPLVLVTYGYHHQVPLHPLGALQCLDRLDELSFDTLVAS